MIGLVAVALVAVLIVLGGSVARAFFGAADAMPGPAHQGAGACSSSWFQDPAPVCDTGTGAVDQNSCEAGYTLTGDGSQASPYTCQTDAQAGGGGADACAAFTSWDNGDCQLGTITCYSGFVEIGGQCVTDVCATFDGSNGQCDDTTNMITCDAGFIEVGGQCVTDVCGAFDGNNGQCANNTITCDSGYELVGGQCQLIPDLCADFTTGNGTCDPATGTVTCNAPDWVLTGDGRGCEAAPVQQCPGQVSSQANNPPNTAPTCNTSTGQWECATGTLTNNYNSNGGYWYCKVVQAAPSTPSVSVNVSSCGRRDNNCTSYASWSAVSGATSYNWQMVEKSGSSCGSNDFSGSGTSTTSTSTSTYYNGSNNNHACYRVRANNSAGSSGWAYKSEKW